MGNQPHKAFFWRRLAAAWVDLFIVYSLTVFLLALTDAIGLRIALEPVYLSIAAFYGTMSLVLTGQTAGKYLFGLKVANQDGGKLTLQEAVIREALGKWGFTVALPVVLGRLILGNAWVATAYDIPTVALVLIILTVYLIIARRTWYDQLAGIVISGAPGPRKVSKAVIFTLIGSIVLCFGTVATKYKTRGYLPCSLALFRSMRSTEPYVAFLNQTHAAPVDYIISLFDSYDVVVLCERVHPEATQWDFIFDVVRDPRFIDRVGHVFTEYGQVGMQAYLDNFMATDSLDPAAVDQRAIHIMQNFAVWPTWTNTNFYTYLKRLYALNQTLPPAKRIRHHLTDASIDWSKLTTPEEYQAYLRSIVGNRDRQMAQNVIDEMKRLEETGNKRPKCLVVMNYRHAFDLTGRSPEAKRMNTFEYLKDFFGDRAANVLLNTRMLVFVPVAGGLWDAAFDETGNRPVGFDFAGSPFGNDPFDQFPIYPGIKGKLKYNDVFAGYVYLQPLDKQYLQTGIPGYYRGFEQEALRRAALVGEDYPYAVESEIKQDEKGRLPYSREIPEKNFETLIEIFMLAINGVGLIIASSAVVIIVARQVREKDR